MTPELWAKVRSLVEASMQLPPGERLGYVRAHAPDDTSCEEAEQLLGYDSGASAVLGLDGWKLNVDSLDPRDDPEEDHLTGTLVGNYRLLREIGRGGMGAVYLAERADGEYEQRVAIKVLQGGIFTAALVKRFRAERQILARLSHQGIARLLDGGLTEDRRPYLVLEYVDGRPIDLYCAEENLDTEAKLRLFLRVAEAVQSAHQQLVLHLDLKPGNILVTSSGEPRLLDFGISRLLSENSNATAAESTLRLLTPRYASPEQAIGAPLGVASDVFSLGTLLYKMLTGRLPYAIEDATPFEAAQILREVAPAAPSSAAHPDIAPALRGDLDTILLHALRKEPERRYPTVAAFADDVQRHLDSRPVEAHADSLGYRVRKFLRRNRFPAAITAAAACVLAVSVAAVIRSNIAAQRERITAQRERATAERRFGDVRQLAHSYIFDLIPELDGIPGTLKVRGEVVKRAVGYLEAMSKERTSDPEVQRELASGYYTLGKLQGASYTISLGDRAAGWDLLNRGLVLQRQIVAAHPDNLTDRAHLIVTLREVANMLVSSGDIEGGHALHVESWEVAQPILAAGPEGPMYLSAANSAWYVALSDHAPGMWNLADPVPGLEWTRRGEAALTRYVTAHPEVRYTQQFIVPWTMTRIAEGDALIMLGRLDEALRIYPELLGMVEREPLLQDSRSIGTRRMVHDRYARLLLAQGNLAGATRLSQIIRPSERKDRLEAGKNLWEAFNMATTIQWAAVIDWRNGNRAEAQEEMNTCLHSFHALAESEPDLTWPQIELVEALQDFAALPGLDPAQSQAMYREVAEIAGAYANRHPRVLSARLEEARAHLGLKRLAASARHKDEARREATTAHSILASVLAAREGLPMAQSLLAEADEPVDDTES